MKKSLSLFRATLDGVSWFRFWLESFGQSKKYSFLIDGINLILRKNTSDYSVINEVFNKVVYGAKPDGIVFDIGANIGAYTLYGARSAEHVFAFEPESSNYNCLKENISLNNFGNIDTFKKAIGDTKRNALLYVGHNNKGMSSTAIMTSCKTEQVEMISLEEAIILCGVDHIDTLKIDIEGGEYMLIENMPDYLFRMIDFINMEFHRVPGKIVKNLIHKLEKEGYEVKVERKFKEYFSGTGIIKAQKMEYCFGM
jgi:FkbM family methyltransferase